MSIFKKNETFPHLSNEMQVEKILQAFYELELKFKELKEESDTIKRLCVNLQDNKIMRQYIDAEHLKALEDMNNRIKKLEKLSKSFSN